MMDKPSVLTHGAPRLRENVVAMLANDQNKCNRIGTFHDVAAMLLDFWQEWEPFCKNDELSLSLPDWALSQGLSYKEQLALGCGNIALKSDHQDTDKSYTNPLPGTEFLTPLLDYVRCLGYEPCRPRIQYLPAKRTVMSVSPRNVAKFHLVLSTTEYAFFLLNGSTVYRTSEVGGLYSLRSDSSVIAVNAHPVRPRIHFTITGYRIDQ